MAKKSSSNSAGGEFVDLGELSEDLEPECRLLEDFDLGLISSVCTAFKDAGRGGETKVIPGLSGPSSGFNC